MDEPQDKEGWQWERMPGGTIRYFPDPAKSISLPHNRTLTQASFSAAFWLVLGATFVLACFGLAVYLI